MKKKILVIGSLNVDMVTEMKQMPVIGETVWATKLSYVPGGKGANQACAAAKLGGRVKMLGCIGKDEFGELQMEKLALNGVDTSNFKISKLYGTGSASIYVDEDGNNSIVVAAGANQECDISYLQNYDDVIKESDYVMLQMEIPYETIIYALKRAKELGKTVVLNPAPAPEELPDDVLSGLDFITPNETELMKLCNMNSESLDGVMQGAEQLLRRGVKHVLVTVGEKGVILADANGINRYPARNVVPVDTTAAGDCFNGAFVVALSEGKSIEEAVRFANAASSIAVTRSGAQTSLPDREETEKILEETY